MPAAILGGEVAPIVANAPMAGGKRTYVLDMRDSDSSDRCKCADSWRFSLTDFPSGGVRGGDACDLRCVRVGVRIDICVRDCTCTRVSWKGYVCACVHIRATVNACIFVLVRVLVRAFM